MTQERNRALDDVGQWQRNATAEALRAVQAEGRTLAAEHAGRLEAMRARFDADEHRIEAEALRRELASAYRVASALRAGVPRWLVPACAAVGEAKRQAALLRDMASGAAMRARKAARAALRPAKLPRNG